MAKRDDAPTPDRSEIERVRERVRSGQLSDRAPTLADCLLGLLLTLMQVVEAKNLSIRRFKRMLFGPSMDTRASSEKQEGSTSEKDSVPSPDAKGTQPRRRRSRKFRSSGPRSRWLGKLAIR